jgi:aryl-alcohol dehydrogenase-like predicted oxidoreductase
MSRKNGMACVKMSRRTFIRHVIDATAMATGVAFAAPLSPSRIPGTRSHAAVPERRNRGSSMTYRRLGKTNIMVSEISFGCALNYGCNPLGRKLNNAMRNLYAKALELGINFFDTSINSDKQYTGEECFQYFKPVRDKVYLSTKVNDFEPASTRASIETSLSRMKTDYIDVVFLHQMGARGGWDKGVPALEEIRKMVGEGKVRFAGVSDHSYSNLIQIGNYAHLVDVILLIYNIKNIRRAEAVISEANSLDIGTFAIKVFGGAQACGTNIPSSWQNDSNLQAYLSKDSTVGQAVVRFVLSNSDLSSALIGMRSQAEITDNVDASCRSNDFTPASRRSTAKNVFRMIYKLINELRAVY